MLCAKQCCAVGLQFGLQISQTAQRQIPSRRPGRCCEPCELGADYWPLPSSHQRRFHSWSNGVVKRGGLVMRTTASFAAKPPLPNCQSDLNPANKLFRSLTQVSVSK